MEEQKLHKVEWTLAIDTREQTPWLFEGITKRIDKENVPVVIPTDVVTLKTGDYSIVGFEDRICIERKSAKDLIQTVAHSRDRFERELRRMQAMEFSAVIVEEEWREVLTICAATTGYNPISLDNSILAWQQRFRGTHWLWRPTRNTAAKTAYKVLDRFYRDRERQQ